MSRSHKHEREALLCGKGQFCSHTSSSVLGVWDVRDRRGITKSLIYSRLFWEQAHVSRNLNAVSFYGLEFMEKVADRFLQTLRKPSEGETRQAYAGDAL